MHYHIYYFWTAVSRPLSPDRAALCDTIVPCRQIWWVFVAVRQQHPNRDQSRCTGIPRRTTINWSLPPEEPAAAAAFFFSLWICIAAKCAFLSGRTWRGSPRDDAPANVGRLDCNRRGAVAAGPFRVGFLFTGTTPPAGRCIIHLVEQHPRWFPKWDSRMDESERLGWSIGGQFGTSSLL